MKKQFTVDIKRVNKMSVVISAETKKDAEEIVKKAIDQHKIKIDDSNTCITIVTRK